MSKDMKLYGRDYFYCPNRAYDVKRCMRFVEVARKSVKEK